MNNKNFSFKSRLASFRFALNGLWSLLKYEHNSRIHLACAIVAILMGTVLKIDRSEWFMITFLIGVVFITELINSAIESLSDYINPEWNEKIKQAKDYSAAAVFISALVSLVVGALIFIPKILDLIFNSSVIK